MIFIASISTYASLYCISTTGNHIILDHNMYMVKCFMEKKVKCKIGFNKKAVIC